MKALNFCHLSNKLLSDFDTLIEDCPRLEELSLSFCPASEEDEFFSEEEEVISSEEEEEEEETSLEEEEEKETLSEPKKISGN